MNSSRTGMIHYRLAPQQTLYPTPSILVPGSFSEIEHHMQLPVIDTKGHYVRCRGCLKKRDSGAQWLFSEHCLTVIQLVVVFTDP